MPATKALAPAVGHGSVCSGESGPPPRADELPVHGPPECGVGSGEPLLARGVGVGVLLLALARRRASATTRRTSSGPTHAPSSGAG